MKKRSPTPPVSNRRSAGLPASSPTAKEEILEPSTFTYSFLGDHEASEFGEFFTHSEVYNELVDLCLVLEGFAAVWQPADLTLKKSLVGDCISQLEQLKPLSAAMMAPDSQDNLGVETLAFVAIGGTHPSIPFVSEEAYLTRVKENCMLLFQCGVLPHVLSTFCCMANLMLGGRISFYSKKQGAVIRHSLTIIYCLLLCCTGLPDFKAALQEFTYEGQSWLWWLFNIVKEFSTGLAAAPAPRCSFPIKKLILTLWKSMVCILNPAMKDATVKQSSGTRVYPEDVTQYIDKVLQNPVFSHLSAEYLQAYYFAQFSPEHTSFEAYRTPGCQEFDHLAIPFSIREALQVFAKQHEKQHDAASIDGVHPKNVELNCKNTAADPTAQKIDENDSDASSEPPEDSYYISGGSARILVPSTSPIENLYIDILPIMTPIVLSLLKLFLASLPNVAPPGQAGPVSTTFDLEGDMNSFELADRDSVELELKRHKEIILKGVSFIMLLLNKYLNKNHPLQAAYLKHLIVEANGVLLILKYLNQKDVIAFLGVTNPMDPSLDEQQDFHNSPASLFVQQNYVRSDYYPLGVCTSSIPTDQGTSMTARNIGVHTCVNFVRTLHSLTKMNVSRLAILVTYKVHVIMKRIAKIYEDQLLLYAAKVLKSILRSVGRKWRANNMKLVSLVYKKVRHDFCDLYAFLETGAEAASPLEWAPPPGHTTDLQVAQEVHAFNRLEYVDPVSGDKNTSLATDFSLDDDFKLDHRKWVDEYLGLQQHTTNDAEMEDGDDSDPVYVEDFEPYSP